MSARKPLILFALTLSLASTHLLAVQAERILHELLTPAKKALLQCKRILFSRDAGLAGA
jgi:hypothetical protein